MASTSSDTLPISIIFRCDAGPIHGFGHVSRCAILGEAFRASGLGNPVFRTYSPDDAGRRFLADRGFAVEPAPQAAGGPDDLSNLLARLAEIPAPRLVVIDSREVDSDYCKQCRANAVVLCIDDEACRDLACDILVNNHPWVSETDYSPSPDRRLLVGAAYNTLPPTIFGESRCDAIQDVGRILITLGGEDPHDHTSWIVRECADILASYDVDVVVGPAHPDAKTVRSVVSQYLPAANLTVAPSGLERFILESDLAISAGGITCYELAAARVPTLAIAVEEHQEPLIASLSRHGSLLKLGSYNDLNAGRVRETLVSVLGSLEQRRVLAEAAGSLFRSPGGAAISEQVAQVIAARRSIDRETVNRR